MALMGCVGSRAREALLLAAEEAVKESAAARLEALLTAPGPGGADGLTANELAQRHLLHQAAWLGHTACVRLLLDHGAEPDEPHRKNGCTPLHLAHFCTIDDTNPDRTIRVLTAAGADINNPGSRKCGKYPIEHAIQHQRLNSVQVLLSLGSQVTLQSMLVAIDVASPQIVELLLLHGADCGAAVDSVPYWGQPLHRALYSPLKCPRESYKQMFRLLVQATVCAPHAAAAASRCRQQSSTAPAAGTTVPPATAASTDCTTTMCVPISASPPSSAEANCVTHHQHHHQQQQQQQQQPSTIEWELRALAKDNADLAQYLLAFLVRNGYRPSESARRAMAVRSAVVDWLDDYVRTGPAPLSDLAVRTVRSSLAHASRGNIMYALRQLRLPSRINNLLLCINPL